MMKKRVLSLALALVMVLGLIPAAAIGVSAAPAVEEFYGGSGTTHNNGGVVGKNNGANPDLTLDYCSILGISKATAEKFGETIRASFRAFDFDIDLTSLGINVGTANRQNAVHAMLEHEVFFAYDTFMIGETTYTYYQNSKDILTTITFTTENLEYTKSEYSTYYNTIQMVAEHLLEGVVDNNDLTDYQKALLLHDRLAAWAGYDLDAYKSDSCEPESYTIVGILWNKVGVCQGYAETYAYLLDRCGIENRFAQSFKLDHIWNIVTIDGAEYYVDVTWDDPSDYDLYGQVNHNFFLVSMSSLRQTHKAYDYNTIKDNTRFDNEFWTESHAEFQLVGKDIFFLDNYLEENARYARLIRWTGNTLYQELTFDEDEAMKWYLSNGRYWTDRNHACLDTWNGLLYVNGATKVYEYNPVEKTWRVCYTPSFPNPKDRIYGFAIHAGRFQINCFDDYPTSDKAAAEYRYFHDLSGISSIKVIQRPNQYVYKVGDNYDFRGLSLEVTYMNGTRSVVNNYVTRWTGYNSAVTGTVTITVELYNKKATFDLKVVKGLSTPKVTVKNATKGITVSWGKVANADEYIVYRSVKSNGKWSSYTRVALTTKTSYTNASAKDGKVYRYAVYAYQGNLRSNLGKSSDIRRLDTPTAKVANSTSGTYISWNKITGAKNYLVYRSTLKNGKWSDWTKVTTTTKTTYTDKKAKGNTQYKYLVKAANGSSKSEGAKTTAIRRLSASTVTAKKSSKTIKLSWTKVTGAKYYAVYRRVAGTSTWTKLYTTKTTSYVDKNAKAGKYYEYAVRAVNGDNLSAYKACKKVKR